MAVTKRFPEISLMLAISLLPLASCTQQQQQSANDKAERAKQDVKDAANKVKDKTQELAEKTKDKTQELTESAKDNTGSTAEKARSKMSQAGEKTKELGSEAKNETQDLGLTTKVKSALANNAGLKTLANLSVESEGSVVTLTGTARSLGEKQRAGRTAMAVKGVSKVVNNIKVEPSQS